MFIKNYHKLFTFSQYERQSDMKSGILDSNRGLPCPFCPVVPSRTFIGSRKLNWRFTTANARIKVKGIYPMTDK